MIKQVVVKITSGEIIEYDDVYAVTWTDYWLELRCKLGNVRICVNSIVVYEEYE